MSFKPVDLRKGEKNGKREGVFQRCLGGYQREHRQDDIDNDRCAKVSKKKV